MEASLGLGFRGSGLGGSFSGVFKRSLKVLAKFVWLSFGISARLNPKPYTLNPTP